MNGITRRSRWGLNSVNFFLAEIGAMVIPYLTVYLRGLGWRYDQIGLAMAAAGLGSLLFQIPAGMLCDRSRNPRWLLAVMALVLGFLYIVLPYLAKHVVIETAVMFLSGIPGTFFMPLLGTLALALAGKDRLEETMGENQSWNHAGNMVSAILAIIVVHEAGIWPMFFIAAGAAFLSAASAITIRHKEIHLGPTPPALRLHKGAYQMMSEAYRLLKAPDVRVLLISVIVYYIACGPMNSVVSLYIKHLGGSDQQVAWLVMISQMVMIPSAWLAGKFASFSGRRFMFGIALVLFPFRILLYIIAPNPYWVMAITALDGVISAILGLMVVLVCSDLTTKRSGFNSLMGLMYTAPSLGAITGSALQGLVTEHWGFTWTFVAFAAIGCCSATFFLAYMPETAKQLPVFKRRGILTEGAV